MSRKKRSRRRRSKATAHRNPFLGFGRKRRSRRSSRRRSNPRARRSFGRRRNPSLIGLDVVSMLKLGAGAIAGGFGARAIPQAVLQASNTGVMGYAANLLATLGLGWAAQKFVGRDVALGVIAGGLSATGMRIWTEQMSGTAGVSGLGDADFSSNGLGWYEGYDNAQGKGGNYALPAQAAPAKAVAAGGGSVVPMPMRGRA